MKSQSENFGKLKFFLKCLPNIRDDIPEGDFYLHRVPLYMPLHKFVYSNQLYHFMLDKRFLH